MVDIADHGHSMSEPCLLLLFPKGGRPSATNVRSALGSGMFGQISFDPATRKDAPGSGNWLELIADGLVFDLTGLAPGRTLVAPAPRHELGIAIDASADCEAIGLAPGHHLAGAVNTKPVVRTLLRIATELAENLANALGAMWLPGGTVVDRTMFLRAIDGWLAGGPFPADSLMGYSWQADGSLVSDGLAFFAGREVLLDPRLCADPAAAVRLLVPLVEHLVDNRIVVGQEMVTLDDGSTIRLAIDGATIRAMPG